MPLYEQIAVVDALPNIPKTRHEQEIYDTSEGPLKFEGTENYPTGDWYDNTHDKYHHPEWWYRKFTEVDLRASLEDYGSYSEHLFDHLKTQLL